MPERLLGIEGVFTQETGANDRRVRYSLAQRHFGSKWSTDGPDMIDDHLGSPIIGGICAVFGPRAGFTVGGVAAIVAGLAAGLSFARIRSERESRTEKVAVTAA